MRKSGLLLHISSLPGAGGIGTLGKEAYAFADFLKKSGMKIWQVLPMGPTGYGESPYQSSSVFAGNPMLISLEMLAEEGLLTLNPGDLYDDQLQVMYAAWLYRKGGEGSEKPPMLQEAIRDYQVSRATGGGA